MRAPFSLAWSMMSETLPFNTIRILRKNSVAWYSAYFILLILFAGFLSPLISPYPYDEQKIELVLQTPSWFFWEARAPIVSFQPWSWMGRDSLGRDLFSRLLFGAQISMSVAIVTALSTLLLGTFYGAISGFVGGWIDRLMMRIVDIIYTLPNLLLMILVTMIFGRDFTGIFIALTIVGWVGIARMVRGQVLQTKEMTYVQAARSMGLNSFQIVFRHILPNILGPIIVTLTYQIPNNILSESFLSFVGLGLQPPMSSWGTLANEGWRALRTHPHLIIFPGLAIYLTMLAFNFFGDGLRDAIDPRMRKFN